MAAVTGLPLDKPGLEPPFLRGLAFALAVSAVVWALLAALVLRLA